MYSNQTVLKAAQLSPFVPPKITYNPNGEPSPPRGRFIQENAEAMA
jgi:hypothetical protein